MAVYLFLFGFQEPKKLPLQSTLISLYSSSLYSGHCNGPSHGFSTFFFLHLFLGSSYSFFLPELKCHFPKDTFSELPDSGRYALYAKVLIFEALTIIVFQLIASQNTCLPFSRRWYVPWVQGLSILLTGTTSSIQ